MAGTIHFYVYPLPAIVGTLRSGQLRALAIASDHRSPALPDLPTSAEAGFPQYRSESWFGMIGPRELPKSLVNRINADVVSVLKEPTTRDTIVRVGAEPRYTSPDEFLKMQRAEYVELGALIRETGMKVQ
jgi:tripartite-type tricarboxylate transporter receptor subunit TctC